MGGDKGPATVVKGAVEAIGQRPDLTVLLVGNQDILKAELARYKVDPQRIEVHHASENITMHDAPSQVVRKKRHSSLHVANQLVKDGQAEGVCSAGNTGAAMAVSLTVLGRIPGIIRPAIMINFPSLTPHGTTSILDVGANVDCKPKMLAQFAVMGDQYCRHVMNIATPRVGLLSVGEEDSKGNELTHESRNIFKKLKTVHYIGNVEGQDIMNGKADVVVCDGFVGNILLKFGEGAMRSFGDIIKREVMASGWMTKLALGVVIPAIKRLYRRMDYKEYGSAPLLGIQGVSTIGHGKSNSTAIRNAILQTSRFCEKNINNRIEASLIENGVAE
jgi:glycerol-3-phosphate acyltransferase PlsX